MVCSTFRHGVFHTLPRGLRARGGRKPLGRLEKAAQGVVPGALARVHQVVAQFAQVDTQRITWLCIAFIAFRVLHGIFYLNANGQMRSLVWFGGFSCVVALMISAALKITT